MTTLPALTPALRAALDAALELDRDSETYLTDDERDALTALRDACLALPPQPTYDGVWDRQNESGAWSAYHVIDSRVYSFLHDDGPGAYDGIPLGDSWVTRAAWRPVVSIPPVKHIPDEQMRQIAERSGVPRSTVLTVLALARAVLS